MFFTINNIVFNSDKINSIVGSIASDNRFFYIDILIDTKTTRFYFDTKDNLVNCMNAVRTDLKANTLKTEYTCPGVISIINDLNTATTCTINNYYKVNMTRVTSLFEWSNQVQICFDNGEVVLFEGSSAHALYNDFQNLWYGAHIAFSIEHKDLTVKMQNILNQSADKINVTSTVSGGVKATVSGAIDAHAGLGEFFNTPIDNYGNILH